MKTYKFIIWVVICALPLVGCGFMEGKAEAEKVVESFFEERIRQGWIGSDKYYSDIFWHNTDKNKWSNIQLLVTKTMGELENYSLSNWNVKSKVQMEGISGTVVTLVCETSYVNGDGIETLTIHKPMMDSRYAIIGHNVNSDLIQQLIDQGIEKAVSENRL